MRRPWIPLIATVFVAQGCYTFTPASPAELQPGQEVRFRLDAETAARLQDVDLPGPRLLDGTFLSVDGDAFVVEAPVGTGGDLRGARVLIQQVDVPTRGVTSVELKSLDSFRTGALVAIGGAALTGVLLHLNASRGTEDGPGGETPESRRVVPIFRIGVPLGR